MFGAAEPFEGLGEHPRQVWNDGCEGNNVLCYVIEKDACSIPLASNWLFAGLRKRLEVLDVLIPLVGDSTPAGCVSDFGILEGLKVVVLGLKGL